MAGIPRFTSAHIQALFEDKLIVVIGDSVQRSVYKDLVCLLKDDRLLTIDELKEKGEEHFLEDTLLEGGVTTGLHNGTNYREIRQFKQNNTTVMFYFVTRCYGEYMQSILDNFKLNPPNVIIMNSCLWDLHRYGKNANEEYIRNFAELLNAVDLAVPHEESLFIWNATLPVRETVNAGFLAPGMTRTIPAKDIRKANLFVRDEMIAKDNGQKFIFLDLHHVFFQHLRLRVKDGVHWNDFAHRKITCLILKEISQCWKYDFLSKPPLPSYVDNVSSQVSSNLPVNTVQPCTGPPTLSKPPPHDGNVGVGQGNDFQKIHHRPQRNGLYGVHRGSPSSNVHPLESKANGEVSRPRCRTTLPSTNFRYPTNSSYGPLPNVKERFSLSLSTGPPGHCGPYRPPGPCGHQGPRVLEPTNHMVNCFVRNGVKWRHSRTCSTPVGHHLHSRHPLPQNNNYVSVDLNETFPPSFNGKRKHFEDGDYQKSYKFARVENLS